ncbi:MAG TPA: DUF1631 domain-containing protein [Gammaproteobacteria bacterium]|nr:DUF1631 domain-containing protein [Gammaproteobacteria bacterium]
MMRARFTDLIDECRQMVTSHLMPLFSNLFENADVVLLEFAEKAESNVAQQRFFEAMKEIQVKRTALEQVFLEELMLSFQRFKDSSHAGVSTHGIIVTEESEDFALVDKDTHEESVALQNMTTKAHLNYANEIHALRQRLALLVGGRKLGEEEIPGGPRQLAECYRVTTRQLALEPRIKIVVFVLFDKFVMSQLADLYQEYNSRLVGAGLLPHLKYEIKKAPDTGVAARRRPGMSGEPASMAAASAARDAGHGRQTVGEETFDAICQLLAGRRQVSGHGDAGVAGARQEPIPRPVLVSAIEQLQQADQASVVSRSTLDAQLIPDIQLDTQLIDNIKITLVQQREKLFGGVDRRRVASADADVIDLVGMIFEYMLNDEAIPNAVKALLSRLHTPFLKVAILDKQFFTQEDHPVRQLLNDLADAGARYVVESDLKRGIFPYMRASVNRILDEFDDQLSIFAEVLAEFRTRLAQMQHTAEVTEQRSREAASGQEKLQQARQRARELIEAGMEGKALPPAITQLLRQVWADKLMFILLRDREGEQSPFWALALRLMADIIDSTVPRADEPSRQELRERLPELQDSLRTGLEQLENFGNDDIGHLYQLLVDSQCAAVDPSRAAVPAATTSSGRHSPATATRSTEPVDTDATGAADKAPSPREEAILRQLVEVEFGTWFEFAETDRQPRRRLKLAWYTQKAGHYMFVDNLGVKAAVKTRHELASGMAAGRVRILAQERTPFVDRAMEAVRNLLRRGEKISA